MTDRMELLYRRFGPVIFARCKRMLREHHAAEDATQEVFVRSLPHLDRLQGEIDIIKWLYRVATNYCLNMIRNQKRRPQPNQDIDISFETHVEQMVFQHELLAQLSAHIPEKLLTPALFYYYDGMDHDNISKILGISRRTVINRLDHFKTQAKKLLARKKMNG